jgi:hypothetical protein
MVAINAALDELLEPDEIERSFGTGPEAAIRRYIQGTDARLAVFPGGFKPLSVAGLTYEVTAIAVDRDARPRDRLVALTLLLKLSGALIERVEVWDGAELRARALAAGLDPDVVEAEYRRLE